MSRPTGETVELVDVRLRAPIVPKKFFHTAGNFREHHEESKNVNWSHPVLPWIVFFQNVDAIIGPNDAIVYPHQLTNEMDYELELAVMIGKAGKFFSPEEAEDYIAGYVVFNDITARDIQREEMKSGVFCLSQVDRHVLPARPVDRHARRGRRPARAVDGAAGQRRGPPVLEHEPHVGDRPGDPLPLLGDGLLGGRRRLDRHRVRRRRLLRRPSLVVPAARATSSKPRSSGSACCATRSSRGTRRTPATGSPRPRRSRWPTRSSSTGTTASSPRFGPGSRARRSRRRS